MDNALNITHLTWKKKFEGCQTKTHIYNPDFVFLFWPFFFFSLVSDAKKEKKIQQESSPLMELLSVSHHRAVLPTCFK